MAPLRPVLQHVRSHPCSLLVVQLRLRTIHEAASIAIESWSVQEELCVTYLSCSGLFNGFISPDIPNIKITGSFSNSWSNVFSRPFHSFSVYLGQLLLASHNFEARSFSQRLAAHRRAKASQHRQTENEQCHSKCITNVVIIKYHWFNFGFNLEKVSE